MSNVIWWLAETWWGRALLTVTAVIFPAASKMRVFQPSIRSVDSLPSQPLTTLKRNSEARILVRPAPSEMIIDAYQRQHTKSANIFRTLHSKH